MRPHPAALAWPEVDPGRNPFDPSLAEAAARGVRGRRDLQSALDEAFRETCGPWAGGWLWGRGEAALDGGPGTIWCCEAHSVRPRGEALEATLERAVRALIGWRAHLEAVSALFRSLPAPTAPERLEEAALELVAFAVEETGCESGWYSYAATLMTWYLESLGASAERAGKAVGKALSGRFESWLRPSDETVVQVVEDFGTLAMRALP